MFKKSKRVLLSSLAVLVLAACSGNQDDQIVIQSNADEEAVAAMKTALDAKGYEGQYVIQSLGTSELGGKLIAEGEKIDADLVTMSSYFIETAQEEHGMFTDLTFETQALTESPSYYTPALAITGSLFVNTELLKQQGLEMPTSIKDLTKPEFKGAISLPNILDSSTGWLLIQAIIDAYGEEEGKKVLSDLIANAGPHLESSGSGPIKKVKAGEVVAGFGLRHQAVAGKEEGAPIEFIDPVEGNFSLSESVAVVKKEDETVSLAMEMAEVIVNDARAELLTYYPVPLYEGESVNPIYQPEYAKVFEQSLTVSLLEQHQKFFSEAK